MYKYLMSNYNESMSISSNSSNMKSTQVILPKEEGVPEPDLLRDIPF